jgi:hypothetical protein
VHVVTRHVNLRRSPSSGSSGVVYIDTDDTDNGPEYVFAGGYFVGTDYMLAETEGFGRKKWGDRVEHGDYIMKLDYKKDRVHLKLSRPALGDPAQVRVSVFAFGTRTDGSSDDLLDWVGEPRSYTPWRASA